MPVVRSALHSSAACAERRRLALAGRPVQPERQLAQAPRAVELAAQPLHEGPPRQLLHPRPQRQLAVLVEEELPVGEAGAQHPLVAAAADGGIAHARVGDGDEGGQQARPCRPAPRSTSGARASPRPAPPAAVAGTPRRRRPLPPRAPPPARSPSPATRRRLAALRPPPARRPPPLPRCVCAAPPSRPARAPCAASRRTRRRRAGEIRPAPRTGGRAWSAPLTTSAKRTGSGFPWSAAAIQCTGRAKASPSSESQRIDLRKGMPRTICSSSGGSASAAVWPRTSCSTTTRSPSRRSASSATPALRANPSAALVHLPSCCACFSGGPESFLRRSGARAAMAVTISASRRGVA